MPIQQKLIYEYIIFNGYFLRFSHSPINYILFSYHFIHCQSIRHVHTANI